MAGINYNDVNTPSFPFSIALGYSGSGYPRLFRARMQGCRRRRQDTVLRITVTRTSHAPHAQLTLGPIYAFIRAPPSIQADISPQFGLCAKWRSAQM